MPKYFSESSVSSPDCAMSSNASLIASNRLAIPMRKGEESAALVSAINAALAEMAEDGTLTELSMKYFGTDISKDQ